MPNKAEVYYFIRDLLGCFPNKVDKNLIAVLNGHSIAKNNAINAFKDEIKKAKPQYRILIGMVIILNKQLIDYQRSIGDSVSVVKELKYCCFVDKRKSLNKVSLQCLLRLFASLYYENKITLSLHDSDDAIVNFKQSVTEDDIKSIAEALKLFTSNQSIKRYIFEQQGIVIDTKERFEEVVQKFYSYD